MFIVQTSMGSGEIQYNLILQSYRIDWILLDKYEMQNHSWKIKWNFLSNRKWICHKAGKSHIPLDWKNWRFFSLHILLHHPSSLSLLLLSTLTHSHINWGDSRGINNPPRKVIKENPSSFFVHICPFSDSSN